MNKLLENILFNVDETKTTCFLCFKRSDACSSIYESLIIWDDKFEYSVSLFSIVKSLFPTFDIIVRQCCEDCSSCLTKIFVKIQVSRRIQTIIYSALKSITSQIEHVDFENIEESKIVLKLNKDCDTCKKENETYYEKDIMDAHLYKCKECPLEFDSEDNLKLHCEASHTNKSNAIICHICGKLFKTSTALESHVQTHKDKQCPYCSKLLKNTSHFKIHLQKHKDTTKKLIKRTTYRCNDCVYTSFNKRSLEAHMYKSHLNIRPFMCTLCQKGFFKKSNLIEHMTFVHSKNSVVCDQCGESFSSNKTLSRHLRIHTNEKSFECYVCGLKFITSGRRTEHMKRKHLPKIESCYVCDKQFSLKKDLNSHVKKCHSLC